MPEAGLFTPSNPVTYYDPLTAYAAAHAHPTEGTCDFPGAVLVVADTREQIAARGVPKVILDQLVYGLPQELQGRGLIPALDWQRTHKNPNEKKASGTLACNHLLFAYNAWVDAERKAAVFRDARGAYFFGLHPCLAGYDVDPWPRWDIDGNHICDFYQTLRLQDNTLQDLYGPGPGDPTLTGQHGLPNTRPPTGGGIGAVSIGGVSLNDVVGVVNGIERLIGGGGASVDVSGIISALAALVIQGGNIRGALDNIPGGLAGEIVPGFLALADTLGGGLPDVARRLSTALDTQTGRQADTARDSTAASAAATAHSIPVWLQALIDASGTILAKVSDLYKEALDSFIRAVLDVFRDDIEARAPVSAENVDKVAAGALRSALTAGTAAQLGGMALELLHPLKQMGVQQAIGVIAEFAGFGEIAKPYFAATLRYGIGLPAEHRAAAHFRSVLPPVGDVKVLAAKGIISLDKYHDRLVLAGYPDPWPEAMGQDVYAELSPRALSAFTDGSEADRPWLAGRLRYAGLSPEDVERVVRALELKATQPGRGRITSALMDDFKHGRATAEDLDAGLTSAGLSPTHRRYYGRAAELERRSQRMETVAGEIVNQYVNDIVGGDQARQLLTGLGFDAGEVTTRLTVADLKRGLKQVKDETKDIEAEIRALKAKGLTNATRQLRAGFLPLPQFLAVGEAMGYTRAYLQNVADVALLQGPPGSTDAEPAIGDGALMETRQRLADLIAREVQLKRTDRVSALVSLLQLGIPLDLGEVLVGIAGAIAGPAEVTGGFGMPAGGKVLGAFADVAKLVLGGLSEIKAPSDLVAQFLARLGLPTRDRAALVRLIRDVRDLFRL